MMKFAQLKAGQIFRDKSGAVLIKLSKDKYNMIRDKNGNYVISKWKTPIHKTPIEKTGYIIPIIISRYTPQPISMLNEFFDFDTLD